MVKPSTRGEKSGSPSDFLPALTATHGALLFTARVTPRARRDVLTIENGEARVRLRAAPVDGAANAALITLLAKQLGVARSALTIVRGDTARIKQIAVSGLTEETLRERFAAYVQPTGPEGAADVHR